MALESGTRLGHYEISEQIGKGGMGEVYRARDTKLGREVAIKLLPSEFSQDPERLARLEREARMLAALNHPNIAAIHGLEESDGTRFLILELVEGETLADRLRRGAIPAEESLKAALQITEALEAAHERGVIHRDLKPANIKLTPEGKVKVLDFGLAKAFSADDRDVNLSSSPTLSMQATGQGVILGTAAYMSPEQIKGRGVDRTSDVWAFGCVLYEMLSGRQAFGGADVTEILAGVIRGEADWTQLPRDLHPRLREILDRCLQKETRSRYRDIADVRFDLQKVQTDPSGVSVSRSAEIRKRLSHRLLPWVAAAAGIVLGVLAMWLATPATPRPVTRFLFFLEEGQSFQNSSRTLVAFSPDGTQVVYNTSEGLYVRAMADLAPRRIQGVETSVRNPVFSPDGRWLAYWDQASSQLKKVSITGGAPVRLTSATIPFGISWSSDGMILYGQPEGINAVSENGGEPLVLVGSRNGEQMESPQLLPGGDWVLLATTSTSGANRWDEARIVARAVGSEDERVLIEGGADPRYVRTGHLVYALGDVLFAIAFDAADPRVVGGPIPIVEGTLRANSPGSNTGSGHYSFSDTGSLVYIPGTGAIGVMRELVEVDLDGSANPLTDELRDYRNPRISSDGGRVATEIDDVGGTHIWIVDLETRTASQLTFEGTNQYVAWTPDGEAVVFRSERDGAVGLFRKATDGSGDAEMIFESADPWPTHVSKDGILAHYERTSQGRDIRTLVLGEPDSNMDFLATPANERAGWFSPDGAWIAYTSDELGQQDEVYVRPFPITQGGVRRISDGGGYAPVWSPAGNAIFYLGADGDLKRLAVDTRAGLVSGRPEGLFQFRGRFQIPRANAAPYDVHPDGDRIIAASAVQVSLDSAPQINVVLNWTQELQDRVPAD